MPVELTYYFSTGSRYSYLSMSQIPSIERRLGVAFRWAPVNGKRIRALRGVDPFKGPPQSGQYDWAYREQDAKAWAQMYGITFNEPRDVEFDVECLLRGVIAAGEQGVMREYAWELAQHVFSYQTWPLNQSVIDGVAEQLNLDMAAFSQACAAPATQQSLEDNCQEAVDRGAFGTPSMFIGDQLFWGNDRIAVMEHHLRLAQLTNQASPSISVQGLDHVVLRSCEPLELVDFYTRLLDTKVERTVGDFLWQIRIGDSLLDIIKAEEAGDKESQNMDHFCLRVFSFDEVQVLSKLASMNIQGEPAPHIYGGQGFGPSVYFLDPQGNRVELKQGK